MNCKSLRLALVATGFFSAITLAQPVLAVPTVFFDRDNSTSGMTSFPNSLAKYNTFTGSLNSFGLDTIESQFGSNPTLSFGGTGITAATQNVFATETPGFPVTIDTRALVESENVLGGPAAVSSFTFNQPITAFGLYVTQGGNIENNNPTSNNNPTTFRLRNTVTSTSTDVLVQVGPGWGFDNVFFLGLTDTSPFNEVSIIETNDNDGQLYDNIVAGNIPEPTSLVLVTLGAICACGPAIRRRS